MNKTLVPRRIVREFNTPKYKNWKLSKLGNGGGEGMRARRCEEREVGVEDNSVREH
jgi:hypothetical protein